jgi:hypothetical protein
LPENILKRRLEMNGTVKDNGKKKGIWALLKESIAKSNDGCGPGCGCHAEDGKKEKVDKGGGDGKKK